jgi:proteasome assembly chaperone (PAC2) family protein
MAEMPEFTHPWLVAVWPGMGHVALNAGYYLLAKLGMTYAGDFQANELFDLTQVEVKSGIIQPGSFPRSRFFIWKDPASKHDLIVLVGEAQPAIGRYLFCRKLLGYAQHLGVERVFTFAAMATQMHPQHRARVFGAAIDEQNLGELKRLELQILEDGQISGLNGLLLGVAAEMGMNGACLLGEIPHIFNQFPFPKASQAILEVFTTMSAIDLDFTELTEHARQMDEQLGAILARIQQAQGATSENEGYTAEAVEQSEPEGAPPQVRGRIEELFREAANDHSKAFELKRELDRSGLFKEYEDRFLDLFKKP